MATEILVPISLFAMTFGIVYIIVTARNRERMALIEKGIDAKEFMSSKANVYNILKWALLIIGLGIGGFIGSLLESYTQIGEIAAYFAPILLFGGLGLLVAFFVTKKAKDSE